RSDAPEDYSATFCAYVSSSDDHPPSPLTPTRIASPPGTRLNPRCSRSTRVRPSPSGVKRTSTSLDCDRSGSYDQSDLIFHAITKRDGGSHAVIWPQSQSVPSTCCV